MSYKDTILAEPGLVDYWRLNEPSGTSAADSKGANTGTYTGTPTLGVTGALVRDSDKALQCDGVDDHVVCKTGAILGGLNAWTIEAWVKTTDTANDAIYCERAATGNDILKMDVRLVTSTTSLELVYRDDAASLIQLRSTTVAVNDGVYHHCVVVRSGTSGTVYQDAVSVASSSSVPASNNFTNAGIESWIGGDKVGGAYLNGTIDEVAIYNVALSAAQVSNHYNVGLGKVSFLPSPRAPQRHLLRR